MFPADLAAGQLNERVVAKDLGYRGIQLVSPPPGKQPFDYFLPDGRTIEIKLDLRSQARHYAAIERPTLDRNADFYIHTLCYYLVFPGNVYRDLYNKRGKVPERKGAMGDQNYEGRLIPTSEMRLAGMYGDQWVKTLTTQG